MRKVNGRISAFIQAAQGFGGYGQADREKRGQMETACLRELLLSQEEKIIATGGGLPMRQENHALLKELGTVVYLRISAKSVWERLKGDTSRPLLQCAEPLARIEELLEKRAPVYEAAADMILDVDGKDMEQVLTELLDRIAEREGEKDSFMKDGRHENENSGY